MSAYLVLARKYRPKTFEEVIGQESVTQVLIGAIEEERIGHAYLFAGPRGTGKTTIARILARALNCERGPTATPCGTCERCIAADEGSEVDVIELDAASHTGVDTIRELRDEVAYAPMRARRKVYIVDEVHMLSKAAFNALLKTLEEPPPHVVFLFATTEPHKVLDTILSRCQVMRLSSLSEERIAARLVEVFRLEGVQQGEGVVEELARMARGGMRDALSLADKLLALAGVTPTLEDLLRLGGETGGRQIEALLASIEAHDRGACLTYMLEVQGDEEQLVIGLLESLRTSLVLSYCGAKAPFITAGERERAEAIERAKRLGPERIELFMSELLRARERMRIVPDQSTLVLESTLLDLCREESTLPLAELVNRLEALEQRLGSGELVPRPPRPRAPAPSGPGSAASKPGPALDRPVPVAAAVSKPSPTTAAPATSAPATSAPRAGNWIANWAELKKTFFADLSQTHAALAELLSAAGANTLQDLGEGRIRIPLGRLGSRDLRLALDRRNQSACSRALSRVTGQTLTVELTGEESASASGTAGGEGSRSAAPAPVAASAASDTVRPAGGGSAPAPHASPAARTGGDAPSSPGTSGTSSRSAAASAPKAAPQKDAFTEQVSDLFGGVIEDNL